MTTENADAAPADDPVTRAIVEDMCIALFGNAYSVIHNGRWLGTFADEQTAREYWPEVFKS